MPTGTPNPAPMNPSTPSAECAPYLTPYRTVVDRVGPRFEALLWNSPATQRARFEAIASMIDLSRRTILDAGCGRADLALWMRQRRIAYRRYIGLDALPEMVEHGKSLGLPHADFFADDFISNPVAFRRAGEPEVIVFSGSLNTIPRSLAMQALERAWETCTMALAFNFLACEADQAETEAVAGTAQKLAPPNMLRWALERTYSVSFKQGYLETRDATVVMWKTGVL